MRTIVFDIETANWIGDAGSKPADLTIALVGIHDSARPAIRVYLENELPQLWTILEGADMLVGYNSDHFDVPLLEQILSGRPHRIKSRSTL